jgi:hypothetical protein
MGTPKHYSREVPARCLQLIDELWPAAERVHVPGQEDRGPLTTTFLLAMATPIITLPIERIERLYGRAMGDAYFDDRPLSMDLADAIHGVFKAARFETAPFHCPEQWRFASIAFKGENLADEVPAELVDQLVAPEAFIAAGRMPVSEWASCLRNALAHGGVLYLDRDGRHLAGEAAERLAFVSAKYPDDRPRGRPERLKVLSIEQNDFRDFLRRWVGWLVASGLSRALAA